MGREHAWERGSCSAQPAVPAARLAALVLGIGNTLLGDEAVGARVIEGLSERRLLPGTHLLDAGTLSFPLLGLIEAADALIVIDAAHLAAAAGTVRSFQGEAMDQFLATTDRRRTVHEVGLLDLLAIARLRDALPERRALVCIQPACVSWSLSLSPAVEAAVPAAADEVTRLLERLALRPTSHAPLSGEKLL